MLNKRLDLLPSGRMEYSRALFDVIILENTPENTRWRLCSSSQFSDDIKNISMDPIRNGKRDYTATVWNRTERFCGTTIHSKQKIRVSFGQHAPLFSFVLAEKGETNLVKKKKKHAVDWLMQRIEISGAFTHNKALPSDHLSSPECLCMLTTLCLACCACTCTCHSFTQEIDASTVICSCSLAGRQFSSPALLLHTCLLACPYYNTDFFVLC